MRMVASRKHGVQMQYMLLLTETENKLAERTDSAKAGAYWAAWSAYIGALRQSGIVVSGSGLEPPSTATTLRVRLIAPLKDRIAALSQELSISQAAAAHQIDAGDRRRNRFIQDHFRKDPADLHNYHIVLDVSCLGVAGCVQMIVDGARAAHSSAASRCGTSIMKNPPICSLASA